MTGAPVRNSVETRSQTSIKQMSLNKSVHSKVTGNSRSIMDITTKQHSQNAAKHRQQIRNLIQEAQNDLHHKGKKHSLGDDKNEESFDARSSTERQITSSRGGHHHASTHVKKGKQYHKRSQDVDLTTLD